MTTSSEQGAGARSDAQGTRATPVAWSVDVAEPMVKALCRLVRMATSEGGSPAGALDALIEETAQVMREHARVTGQGAAVHFGHSGIYVSGRLLRACRSVYDECLAIGQVLDRCGIAEIAVAKDVFPADLRTFATLIADFNRCPEPVVPERITPRIRLRPVNDAARRHEIAGEQHENAEDAVVQTYASAIVLMRRFFESLQRGDFNLPQGFKRIAQRLVDLSDGGNPAFLGVTAARNANHDDAGRAVNTAILSLAMARQISADIFLLERLAMAALLYDIAKPRLTGAMNREEGHSILPSLTEDQDADMPAGTAVMLTALGRLNEESTVRSVIAFEAHWLKRQSVLGPLYKGLRQPALLSRIVAVARAFNDLLTPSAGREPVSADNAVAKLEQEADSAADRTVLRLLVGALGIFPTGTLVELSTGEVALVVQTSSHPARYSLPRVRLVFDASGGAVDHPVEIDLAQAFSSAEPRRHIRRVVATSDDAFASTMRSLASGSPHAAGAYRSSSGYVTHRSAGTASQRFPAQPDERSTGAQPDARDRQSYSGPATPPTVPASLRAAQMRGGKVGVRPGSPEPPPVSGKPASAAALSSEEPARSSAWTAKGFQEASEHTDSAYRRERRRSRPDNLPAPTANGLLSRTPLAHLLVYMLDRRLTGTTVFTTPEDLTHTIFFNEGTAAKVKTGTLIAPLMEVVADLGLIEPDILRQTFTEALHARMLHGNYLIEKGFLDRETMIGILNVQLVRKVLALFEMSPQTSYEYYDGVNLLSTYGGPELQSCEPLALLMAGIRVRSHDTIINTTLERVGRRPMILHPDSDPRRFRFHRDEAAIVDLLRARKLTLDELIDAGVAPPHTVRLTVYALAITRHLDLGGGGKPPVGVHLREGEDPRSLRANPASFSGDPSLLRDTPRTSRTGPPSVHADSRTPLPTSAPSPRAHTPPQHQAAVSSPMADSPARPAPENPPVSSPPSGGRPLDASQPSAQNKARTGFGIGFGQPQSKRPLAQAARPSTSETNAPAVENTDAFASRRAALNALAERAESADHFIVLGTPRDATPTTISKAYLALAKEVHPDRLPAELADMRPLATRVFARIAEAHRVLSDPGRRAEHLKALETTAQPPKPAGAEQLEVERAVGAALEFQKGEILLKNNDIAGAEQLIQRAFDADPEQPEYGAALAWIQALKRPPPPPLPEGAVSNHYDDLIQILDQIVAKAPRYEKAIFYRGTLLKRSGRLDKAILDFRLVTELNPKNVDAMREVRLHEMRTRGEGPSKSQPKMRAQGSPGVKGAETQTPPDGSLINKLLKR